MPFTTPIVTHGEGLGINGGTTATSKNTTGANLIVVKVASDGGVTVDAAHVTDSPGNTYLALTGFASVGRVRFFYCFNPTTSATHTWTVTRTNSFCSINVEAWAGADTAQAPAVLGGDTEDNDGGTTIEHGGGGTPAWADALVIAGCSQASAGTMSIDGGFTAHDEISFIGSNRWGGEMAYLVQTAAAAANPTWTTTSAGNFYAAAVLIAFKPSSGGGGLTPPTYAPGFVRSQSLSGDPLDSLAVTVDVNHKGDGGGAQTFRWSDIPLVGPTTYWKPVVFQFGTCITAISERGRFEGNTFSFGVTDTTQSPTDERPRGWLANANQRALINVEVVVKVITFRDLHAGNPHTVLWRGRLSRYQAEPGFLFTFECQDWLSSMIERPIYLRRIGDDFTGAPAATRDRVAPIYYGTHSVDTSAAGTPTIGGTGGIGAFGNNHGWGDHNTGVASVVSDTGLTVTTGATGAAGCSPDVPNGEYAVMVIAIDSSDRIANPNPSSFYTDHAVDGRGAFPSSVTKKVTVTGANQKITVSWSASGGAAKYWVFLGWFYYETVWIQRLETTGTSVDFDQSPAQDVIATTSNISTGATLPSGGSEHVYRVASLKSGVESAPSDYRATPSQSPYARYRKIEWSAASGSPTGYRIYRKAMPGVGEVGDLLFTEYQDVGLVTSFTDTGSGWTVTSGLQTGASFSGFVPSIYVGQVTSAIGQEWHGFAVCAHACKSVDAVCQGGVVLTSSDNLTYPGAGNYATHFGGFGATYFPRPSTWRYTMIFARGAIAEAATSNEAPLRANIKGIESAGDSSGTLLENLLDQFGHFLDNFVLRNDITAANPTWSSTPTWTDGTARRDTASFTATATAEVAALSTTERKGAWAILEAEPLIKILEDLAISGDYAFGSTRAGQVRVVLEDPDTERDNPTLTLTDTMDIAADSFTFRDDLDRRAFFNSLAYEYQPYYDDDGGETFTLGVRATDAAAQTTYGILPATAPVRFKTIRAAAGATVRAKRKLWRASVPTRDCDARVGLYAMSVDIGDPVAVTHAEGPGASGWSDQTTRVRRMAIELDRLQAYMTLRAYVSTGGTITEAIGDVETDSLNASLLDRGTVPPERLSELPDGIDGSGIANLPADTSAVSFSRLPSGSGTWAVTSVNITGTVQVNGSAVVTNSWISRMVAIFPDGCPSGWTRYSALDGLFPRGAASHGATGGSSSHAHDVTGTAAVTISGHNHGGSTGNNEAPGNATTDTDGINLDFYSEEVGTPDGFFIDLVNDNDPQHDHPIGARNHGHSISSDGGGTFSVDVSALATDSISHLPPHMDVIWCRLNT